jgi:hypothetical protein
LSHTPNPFALVIFEIEFLIFPGASLDSVCELLCPANIWILIFQDCDIWNFYLGFQDDMAIDELVGFQHSVLWCSGLLLSGFWGWPWRLVLTPWGGRLQLWGLSRAQLIWPFSHSENGYWCWNLSSPLSHFQRIPCVVTAHGTWKNPPSTQVS